MLRYKYTILRDEEKKKRAKEKKEKKSKKPVLIVATVTLDPVRTQQICVGLEVNVS